MGTCPKQYAKGAEIRVVGNDAFVDPEPRDSAPTYASDPIKFAPEFNRFRNKRRSQKSHREENGDLSLFRAPL